MTLDQIKEKIIGCKDIISLNLDDIIQFRNGTCYEIATINSEIPAEDLQRFTSKLNIRQKLLFCLILPKESNLKLVELSPISDFINSLSVEISVVCGVKFQIEGDNRIQAIALYK